MNIRTICFYQNKWFDSISFMVEFLVNYDAIVTIF